MSLGNVLSAKAANEKIPFIAEKDLEVYKKYRDAAFEVQVGLHELTGHGCGKLLRYVQRTLLFKILIIFVSQEFPDSCQFELLILTFS